MLVRTDIPKLITAGMKKEFMKMYAAEVVPEFDRIATTLASNKKQETYPWLGSTPTMHAWKDERIPEGLLEHYFTVVNRDFEASVSIDKTAIEDELYGQISIKVKQLAQEAKRFIGELLFTLLDQGNATAGTGIFDGVTISCYDGGAFFKTTHSEGLSGSQSNYGTTNTLTQANLRTAITTMKALKDDKGKYMSIIPDLLLTNQNNEFIAREILESTYFPTLTSTTTFKLASNVTKGIVDLYITPYVSLYHWFVLDTHRVMKPLIFQNRKGVEFTSLLTGPDQFLRKKLYFGVDFRGEAAFGMWQYAYGSFATS